MHRKKKGAKKRNACSSMLARRCKRQVRRKDGTFGPVKRRAKR